jgi:hypothetical protein
MGNVDVPTQNNQPVKMAVGTYEFGANLVSSTVRPGAAAARWDATGTPSPCCSPLLWQPESSRNARFHSVACLHLLIVAKRLPVERAVVASLPPFIGGVVLEPDLQAGGDRRA